MFQKNMTNQSEPGYNREGVFDNFRLSNPGALRGPFCSIPQVSSNGYKNEFPITKDLKMLDL